MRDLDRHPRYPTSSCYRRHRPRVLLDRGRRLAVVVAAAVGVMGAWWLGVTASRKVPEAATVATPAKPEAVAVPVLPDYPMPTAKPLPRREVSAAREGVAEVPSEAGTEGKGVPGVAPGVAKEEKSAAGVIKSVEGGSPAEGHGAVPVETAPVKGRGALREGPLTVQAAASRTGRTGKEAGEDPKDRAVQEVAKTRTESNPDVPLTFYRVLQERHVVVPMERSMASAPPVVRSSGAVPSAVPSIVNAAMKRPVTPGVASTEKVREGVVGSGQRGSVEEGPVSVQVSSFRRFQEAAAQASRMQREGIPARVVRSESGGGESYQVRVGPFPNREEAGRSAVHLGSGGQPMFIRESL